MVFFLNTNIKNYTNTNIALYKIFGIGKFLSKKIIYKLGISENIKFNKLNTLQIEKISNIINENFYFGKLYKEMLRKQKNRLIQISSYRGFRFKQKLPARGQRTHTNAKTAKKLNSFE